MSLTRLDLSDLGTVLGVWAHPDDECYLMSGTALLAASAGSHIACVTATAGEAGETSDEERWPRARLAEIRRGELAAGLAVVGIDDHTWLGLPDGGLDQVDPTVAVPILCDIIDRVRPDTVLTFGRDGMTGHPDHIVVGDWAEQAAATVLGDRCHVLAATKTPAWLDVFADVNIGLIESDPPRTPVEELALALHLDGDLLSRKVQALEAQASQTAALIASMGPSTYRDWVAEEFWVRRA
jgi:LmbE family N-acetylglucosaminyl deacetylase